MAERPKIRRIRRRRVLIGVAGMAAVLGVGTVLAQQPTAQVPITNVDAEAAPESSEASTHRGTTVRRERLKAALNVDASKVKTVEKGTLKDDRRTMRIVSSRQDLTGFRELGWIADEGVKYGEASCSRKVQVNDEPPEEKPTLLMCWRTSEKKSVYTVVVDLEKNPTPRDSLAALEKQWARMT